MKGIIWISIFALSFALSVGRATAQDNGGAGSESAGAGAAGGAGTADGGATGGDRREALSSLELPMPEIPSTIATSEGRADYVMTHFWDALDVADTERSHNPDFIEINFVNYIYLFSYVNEDLLPKYIDILLSKVSADEITLKLVIDYADKYLAQADSPMRDETFNILFLEGELRLKGLSLADRARISHRLEIAMKNCPGSEATDFAYTTRTGESGTLYNTRGELMLLIFYDPDCPHCKDVLEFLDSSNVINSAVASGILKVVAIYTEGNRELWNQTKASMPRSWLVGIDESEIVDSVLYDLPAMPVLYLLDSDKVVLLKDPVPEYLEYYLSVVLE